MTEWVPSWQPGEHAAALTRQHIAEWVRSEPLWQLVSHFGPSEHPTADTDAVLAWLDEFSARHWDFRGGRERNLATVADLTATQQRAALALCPQLGLIESRPARQHYDAVVMTGGMVRAGLVKPRYVRSLLDAGLDATSVVFLGAHRPFGGDEAQLARSLGVPGDDEVDAMVHGVQQAFRPVGARVESAGGDGHGRWSTAAWPSSTPALSVVATPSPRPQRRADTADTFRHWAGLLDDSVRSVLLVTTPIYVPYQAAVGAEVLGVECGFTVETVGVDAAANDLGEHTQQFEPQHHLQELRSAIRGLRSLHAAVASD